jgi:hypothetical protein
MLTGILVFNLFLNKIYNLNLTVKNLSKLNENL